MVNILLCGDVIGRAGREAALQHIKRLRAERAVDFVIVNADNAAHGFGVTPNLCQEFFAAGVDVITGGDHIWDQKEIVPYIAQEKRLLRPYNYPSDVPGRGVGLFPLPNGKELVVLHLLGQVFLKDYLDSPFAAAKRALTSYRPGQNVAGIVVDFHAEATSEKMAMGKFLDGEVSAVLGSHTHVPTHDARILPRGTAYQTDLGMCGDYDSVIGFAAEGPLARFQTKIHKHKMDSAKGPATFCGAIVGISDTTGLAERITPLRLGGVFDE